VTNASTTQPRASSWARHHDLIKDLEKRAGLHPEEIGYTIKIEIGYGGGLRALKVLVEEDRHTTRR